MAEAVRFYKLAERLAKGELNLATDQFAIVLSNTLPDITTDEDLADITEISGGNGYTSGGINLTTSAAALAANIFTLSFSQLLIQASGGSIGPFQYIVLVDKTHASDALIQVWDYDSPITLSAGQSFRFSSNGPVKITV